MADLILNYRTIFYKKINGDHEKPYLIFLHEGLGCCSMWKSFPDKLCSVTNCPGLIFDRTGYGKSSPAESKRTIHYLHDYALNELHEVIKKLIPDKPFIFIGHSDGGSIALIYGAEKPSLLKGIVTEAAHVFVDELTIEGIRTAEVAYQQGKLGSLNKHHGKKTHSMFKAWSDTWLSDWFKHWNIEYLLPSIDVPVLAIQGCDDQYGTKNQVESIVEKSSGAAESFLVENCGHSPHMEQAEIVINRIAAFVVLLLENNHEH